MMWGFLCLSTVLVLALSHGTPFRGRDQVLRLSMLGCGVLLVLTIGQLLLGWGG